MVVHHWSYDGMVMYHRRSLDCRLKVKLDRLIKKNRRLALISTKSWIIINLAPVCPPPTISSVPNATFGYEDKVFGREVFGRQEAHRSGQGWQGCKLPPRAASSSFWLFMLLPIRLFAFHASDTNGLMVAKPVTCLPNWLLHYGSPNKWLKLPLQIKSDF